MKEEEIQKVRKNGGITLIALVITIIVLLILAAVTIGALAGKNGILTKVTEAKDKNEIATEKEEISMAYAAAKTGKVDKIAEDVTVDELNAELGKVNSKGTASGTGTLTVTYENGHKYTIDQETGAITGPEIGEIPDGGDETKVEGVTIPKGFYYVGGTKEEGIVISDDPADENKGTSHEVAEILVGNQFVWVPVEVDNAFKTYRGYWNKELQSFSIKAEEPYLNGYGTEQAEYDAMKKSVLEYDGFYIARYEASKDEEDNTKVASKQGKKVWNEIQWGNSMSDIGKEGAVYKSQQMYKDKEKYGVTSTLVYGVQWDSIMSWIDPAYKTETCDVNNSFVANSTDKGYYDQSSPTVTGSNENYAVKNIYDLAGNVLEWTMEAFDSFDSISRIYRGGCYDTSGDEWPASSRIDAPPDYSLVAIGFRPALYL